MRMLLALALSVGALAAALAGPALGGRFEYLMLRMRLALAEKAKVAGEKEGDQRLAALEARVEALETCMALVFAATDARGSDELGETGQDILDRLEQQIVDLEREVGLS